MKFYIGRLLLKSFQEMGVWLKVGKKYQAFYKENIVIADSDGTVQERSHFDVLLTVHLSIFISVINQLNAQILVL